MKHISITSFIFAVMMIFNCANALPVYAEETPTASSTTGLTEEEDYLSGQAGENVTWAYDPETQTLTFSGAGSIDLTYAYGPNITVQANAPIWINCDYAITHVIIEEGITSFTYYDTSFFGSNNLSSAHTITVPESVTEITNAGNLVKDNNITYYGKIESYFYYTVEENSQNFVSTGTAENPYYETSGTTENGITWRYDLDTKYLYYEGNGVLDYSDFGAASPFHSRSATRAIVIGKDVIISDETLTSADTEFERNYFMQIFLTTQNNESKPCYYYAGSSFDETLQTYLSAEGQNISLYPSLHCIEATVIGDVNMDGSINLIDAVLLEKYLVGTMIPFDDQRSSMDCDKNGEITANDAYMLMQFILQIVDTL